MKILIIYESKYGNGKILAAGLQELLRNKSQDAEIFSVRNLKPSTLPWADIYVFSSPVRMFMLPLSMRSFLRRFKPVKEGAKYALMTTYMDPRVKALEFMEKLLQSKGMIKITDGFKVKVMDMKGPLEEGYRKRLEKFTAELIKS